jgi:hypothetical protein
MTAKAPFAGEAARLYLSLCGILLHPFWTRLGGD